MEKLRFFLFQKERNRCMVDLNYKHTRVYMALHIVSFMSGGPNL